MPDEPCDHEWEVIDDSFDHAFGTERVIYDRCKLCEATREHDSRDDHFEPGDLD